jgi:glycosyltransferase involved in cell wall biosynthesis
VPETIQDLRLLDLRVRSTTLAEETVAVAGLSICIPVLNEEDAITETLERCLACEAALEQVGIQAMEVIVVDDGSKDHTAERVRQFPKVRLIQHEQNRGYGAALKTGFKAARYGLIGFLDADATYPPEEFPALCRAMLEQQADLVIGSRMAGSDSEMPRVRRIGNRFFAMVLNLAGRTHVSDTASGMRVFSRDTLKILSPLPDGLNLTPVMSTRAAHERIKVIEVPIPYRERVGRSKLSVTRDGVKFLATILGTVLSYNPVRILGFAGLLGCAIAGCVVVGLVVARLRGYTSLGPLGTYAVFAAMVSGVAGVSIFSLGASFNYFVSLFHKRPIRQGLFNEPLFKRPLERTFLPVGGFACATGIGLSLVSVTLAMRGWPVERLWLYLTGSAMLILVGVQLTISWLEMTVLRELSEREGLTNGS